MRSREQDGEIVVGGQVCPRSAKVQLNMGITERRYYNWDVALEHFEAAQALSTPGFCEPLYWLGVTRINAGHDIGRGAQVLRHCLLPRRSTPQKTTPFPRLWSRGVLP